MTIDHTPNRPWYKEPMVWLVTGLPAIAVVASFTSYYFAARDPDTLLKSEYTKVGLAMVANSNSPSRKAAAMQVSAHLSNRNGQLELVLAGRLQSPPKKLMLEILHPSRENQDMRILFLNAHDQTYIAAVPKLGTGKKMLTLEPEDGSWRINGQWMSPFTGTTELSPRIINPSTHP